MLEDKHPARKEMYILASVDTSSCLRLKKHKNIMNIDLLKGAVEETALTIIITYLMIDKNSLVRREAPKIL
uniref:Uncharacterized protein n=1 Tax=Timema cristinae TaxID=61476 RepID=A0A7R9CC33_TIMCR|nr:unnamed protein product [Timema cristinae]